MSGHLIRGQLVTFDERADLIHEKKGAVVVGENGRITWRGALKDVPKKYLELNVHDYGDKLLLPGFIDPHLHFPQYRMLAAPGKDLLDWLQRFTFPEEAQYANTAHAEHAAKVFLALMISNGTTSASVFCSSHAESVNALFATAEKFNMALITGKTMMDTNVPDEVSDTAEQSCEDSRKLIEIWHGKSRLQYAITPRFAVTSSQQQLQAAGRLLEENPGMMMQTHLSENLTEIETVEKQFPDAASYTDVYDRAGLLGNTSLFAHGIYLSEDEKNRLAETGSTIIHCPTSNMFLGSGLFDLQAARAAGINVGLATDVGGGTSYSMLMTMAEAYKIAMLNGYMPSAVEMFHMATLGNAECLNIERQTGSIDAGKWADIVVLDPLATHVQRFRQQLSSNIKDTLFSLMMLGDDRSVVATYIAGVRRFRATVS
jgi:guanine deaminase